MEKKIDKLDYIRIINICATNDTIKKVRIQSTECKKIYHMANHISNKRPVSRIYIFKSLKVNNKKPNNPITKQAKDLDKHFSKENI